MISDKNSLSFENKCRLIAITTTENEYGIPTVTKKNVEVFCAELPVTANEFFNASQRGFKAQRVLVVNSDEYNEESIAEYNNKRYSVYRYYQRTDGYTELYCAERIGNG